MTDIDYTVETLSFSKQGLTELPDDLLLYTNLKKLYCIRNHIKKIPPLPPSLILFDCRWNEITELPPLPASLQVLWCSHNQMTALPPLPASLQDLECDFNNLMELPPLPALKTLYCQRNQLKELPLLPPFEGFNCSDNPFLEYIDFEMTKQNIPRYNEWYNKWVEQRQMSIPLFK